MGVPPSSVPLRRGMCTTVSRELRIIVHTGKVLLSPAPVGWFRCLPVPKARHRVNTLLLGDSTPVFSCNPLSGGTCAAVSRAHTQQRTLTIMLPESFLLSRRPSIRHTRWLSHSPSESDQHRISVSNFIFRERWALM